MTSRRPAATLAGGARGVEVYTRVSLYLFVLLEPFLFLYAAAALSGVGTVPGAGAALVLVVLGLLHTALCFATVHVGFDHALWHGRRPGAVVVALAAVTVALVVAVLLVLPAYDGGGVSSDPRTVMLFVTGAATIGALAVAVPMGRLMLLALVVPLGLAAARAGSEGMVDVVPLGLGAYTFTLLWAGTLRMSMWIVEVVRALDDARGVAARLAVAEERLRISRDMHDVVGRALSAVAVKAELAGALARRGDARAADQMDEVRTLAQDSLREVRGVVAGYRAADLATELDGARSVLHAAGTAVRVVGDVPDLAAPQVEALAWVVREAVTNIVRHSAATACRIDLEREEQAMVLRVSNDGARTGVGGVTGLSGGSGLAGLRERLAAVGGELHVAADGDRFVVTARVPVPSGVVV
ncbi:histidine kinase [Isoptericola sp. NEAU-Y5]|uniref:Histidine kinase n=1 Tax=Isoptericola luteus TaxID=2879484 RepID=A0ABS7ZKH5_9MICO|nr:histidine kinase [Isoptericola sp. NEAU-Y5]MCA5894349.1 histidine kinase [Isoptericola sp. NEAU-Y5]